MGRRRNAWRGVGAGVKPGIAGGKGAILLGSDRAILFLKPPAWRKHGAKTASGARVGAGDGAFVA